MKGTARGLRGGEGWEKNWERTGEKRGEQRGNGLAGSAERWDRASLCRTEGGTGRGPRVTAGGDVGRQGGQEGRDRLEWGQEGGAGLGRLDREDGNGAGSQV